MGFFSDVEDFGKGALTGTALYGMNPTIAGGLMGIAVGGAGSYLQYQGAKEQREADLASAREQMAFQERMSSTAHQREVEDLRKAGLNPVLSANSGASTPVGASIDAQNMMPQLPDVAGIFATAQQIKKVNQEINESKARIDLLKSQKRNTDTDTATKRPYAEMSNGVSKGISNFFSNAKALRDVLSEGVPERDISSRYIDRGTARKNAENLLRKKGLSPRGKNVPLYDLSPSPGKD